MHPPPASESFPCLTTQMGTYTPHTGPPHTVPSVLGVMLEIAQHTWERALEPWLRRWQGCVRSSPAVFTHGRTLRFAQSVTAPKSAGMQVCRAGLRWSVCSGGALGLFLLLISSAITTLYRSAPAGPLSPPPSPPGTACYGENKSSPNL